MPFLQICPVHVSCTPYLQDKLLSFWLYTNRVHHIKTRDMLVCYPYMRLAHKFKWALTTNIDILLIVLLWLKFCLLRLIGLLDVFLALSYVCVWHYVCQVLEQKLSSQCILSWLCCRGILDTNCNILWFFASTMIIVGMSVIIA